MSKCSHRILLIQKDDKFSLMQCPKNDVERKELDSCPYASAVGSLMYLQNCTKLDIIDVVGKLGKYQVNLELIIGKLQKKYKVLVRTKHLHAHIQITTN